MPAFQRLYRGYGRLLRGFGLISSLATFLMMLVVVANIAGRYLFNRPLTGTLEFTEVAPGHHHLPVGRAHPV